MQRFFIEIAFNGGAYHGWQAQPNAPTVQQALDSALGTICRQPVETVGCGRTDAGVHAKQLFAHFDLNDPVEDPEDPNFAYRLNALLPYDIAAKRVFAVAPGAHARFDATQRHYEYFLHTGKDPFRQGLSWQVRSLPDLDKMNEAAHALLAYRDFSCFSKSNTQTFTNDCTISQAAWTRVGPGQLVFTIAADRFLRNMVRAIVGTLLEIGNGDKLVSHIHEVVGSKNRSMAGMSVPAHGLYLARVLYPYVGQADMPCNTEKLR